MTTCRYGPREVVVVSMCLKIMVSPEFAYQALEPKNSSLPKLVTCKRFVAVSGTDLRENEDRKIH